MPDLADTVILLGFLQGMVLSVVLARRRADRLANRLLSALVGAVSLMLGFGYVNDHFGFRGHPHLLGLGGPLPFLFGPLLYLYIVALTRPLERFEPRLLVHGLPFVADVVFLLQVFYLESGDEKLRLALESAVSPSASYRLVGALQVLQALSYVVASGLALRRYERKMRGYFSDLTRIDLRWLMVLVVTHGLVWGTVFGARVLAVMGADEAALGILERTTQLGSSLAIFLMGYVSLWQPELFQKARAAEPEPVTQAPAPTERVKYQRNRLDDDEAEQFAAKLAELMEREQAFRDASLTLPVLADTLGTTPHQLSQILNVRLGRSFYVFVNSYRVEALKSSLVDPARRDRGVLELALEVGFNSKSTLNSFFKKHTGVTPTEYRRRAASGSAGLDA